VANINIMNSALLWCQVPAARKQQNLSLVYQSISTWSLSVTVLRH